MGLGRETTTTVMTRESSPLAFDSELLPELVVPELNIDWATSPTPCGAPTLDA